MTDLEVVFGRDNGAATYPREGGEGEIAAGTDEAIVLVENITRDVYVDLDEVGGKRTASA